jgi:hypothetical protein
MNPLVRGMLSAIVHEVQRREYRDNNYDHILAVESGTPEFDCTWALSGAGLAAPGV